MNTVDTAIYISELSEQVAKLKNETLELRAMINALYESMNAQLKLEKAQTKNIFELRNIVEKMEDDIK